MPEKPREQDYLRFSPYIHPSVMYRREILEECGYSISEDTLRCEDYEIFMRLCQHGFFGYNIQQPLLYYREEEKSYHRRTLKYRVKETKIRYRNFKKMNILFPFGWMYVLRPIIGGLIPIRWIAWIKRRESGYRYESIRDGNRIPTAGLPRTPEKKSVAVSGAD